MQIKTAKTKIKELIKLTRPLQWYKNLLVFLPIIFIGQFFVKGELLMTFLGFISLCLVSSANYIINDIIDIKKDRLHPEKKKRPLASGKIMIWQALVLFVILLSVSIFIALQISLSFLGAALFLFIFTLIYSVFLKKQVFADMLSIGINFIIRAISGTFIINAVISPWLILCTFFLAMFLTIGKRHADLMLLGPDAGKHRQTLQFYTKELTNALMIIATCLLVMSYSLYSFMSEHNYLIYTLPFALYVIFRYFQLVYQGSPIARHPERVFTDLRMVIGMILSGLIVFVTIYFSKIISIIT